MSLSKTAGFHFQGTKKFKARRSVIRSYALRHQIPDVHISDKKAIREQVWDFDPTWEFEYSQRELMLMAEKILLLDTKPPCEDPVWLPASEYLSRLKREIYVGTGMPDPAVESGLYWRSHPQGRKVSSMEQRRGTAASFYR